MTKLSIVDLGFFLTETPASPKHVSGLMLLRKPASAGPNYVRQLMAGYLGRSSDVQAPFNQVIKYGLFSPPHWANDPLFDIDEHVFFHHLEGEDFRDSLYELAGELHSGGLDPELPMWEFHVIEGSDARRFALFVKIHHAYADGVTMARWLANSMSASPRSKKLSPLWYSLGTPNGQQPLPSKPSLRGNLSRLNQQSNRYFRSALGLSKLSTQLALEAMNLTKNAVAVPFRANPHTPLTGQVRAGRQIATAALPMARVNRLRKQTRSTLNHIALTCIDGALHRYLQHCGADIDQPITIQMPVNLRQQDDHSFGNKIGMVLVELASTTEDPYQRLREIGFTLRNVRYQVDGVPPASIVAYTALTGGLAMLSELLQLGDAFPPLGHTLVSNVPGPTEALYLKGSKLEEMYPISALAPNNHLNITLFSYDGRLQFGLVATTALPALQQLGDYIHQAFAELEEAVAPSAAFPS